MIEGHTDGSMRGTVPKSLVQELSLQPRQLGQGGDRPQVPVAAAESVRQPGIGWDKPAETTDPENHAKNRRVEIKVYPAEATTAK